MIRALLNESKISDALRTNYWRVRVLDEVGSTQDELKNELVSNGDCVVAEYQSAGRGRLDRKFESAPHVALLFSFYIEAQRKGELGWVPLIAGTSVAQSLNTLTQTHNFATKWPNDVIADSGKTAGVLCERYGEGIIVGIGINVSTLPEELPVPTATSVFIETGMELDRNIVLAEVLTQFADLFARWESHEDLTPRYRALSSTIGKDVQITLPDFHLISGRAKGVDSEGQLFLENGYLVNVGDVLHLR